MAAITFENVSKTFADGTHAVDDLSLEIEDGELMVFVGPSGCGKTTSLRMVAGLEEISGGEIRIGDTLVNDLDPRQRDVAMVFQNYALYPHMTVFENIAFPLRSRRMRGQDIKDRVERTASLLGLQDMLRRRPKTLSGGQRQRVAMGRAIVREPQVFLMDEPLSNLDAKLRTQMRAEITQLQRTLGTTTIYVTHDQVEAMTMGTRIAIMRKGVLQQHGTPTELYDTPANLFVASFIGSPAMNLFKAQLEADDGGLHWVVGGRRGPVPAVIAASHRHLADYVGRAVAIGIRPEHLSLLEAGGSAPGIDGTITLVENLGVAQLAHIEIEAEPVLTEDVLEIAADTDAALVQNLEQEAAARRVALVIRAEAKPILESGRPARLGMQAEHVHFFDVETGIAIR
jgi:multiple sugar transport system ATP-binding protein